jgi:hypothetical protein
MFMSKTTIPYKIMEWIIFGMMVCFFGAGCTHGAKTMPMAPDATPIKSVLVLPFKNMAAVYGSNMTIRCPLDGKVYMTGTVADAAQGALTRHLIMLIDKRCACRMIPPSNALGIISKLTHPSQTALSEKNMFVKTGRILGADAVIKGHIYRFEERLGGNYSVATPAAVTFDLHIIQVSSGRILWSGKFNETQKSLDKNLLNLKRFVKRKGQWVTAGEMAETGLEELVGKVPLTRQ